VTKTRAGVFHPLDLVDHGTNAAMTSDDLVTRLNRLAKARVLRMEIEMLQRVSQRDEDRSVSSGFSRMSYAPSCVASTAV
jgi:hypothetical protein